MDVRFSGKISMDDLGGRELMFDNIFFMLSALATCGGAVAVAMARNLMHSCIYLLLALFGMAGLYATLGADFLAAAQLVVYGGGVIILMLFAVMLTGGVENRINRFGLKKVPALGNFRTYIIATIFACLIGSTIFKLMLGVWHYRKETLPLYSTTVDKIGTLLVTDYVLAFEISSVLLLGALIGAAVIARPQRNIIKEFKR